MTTAERALRAPAIPRRQTSLWGDALRRLVGHRGARLGFVLVAGLLLLALLAPTIARQLGTDPNLTQLAETLRPPSAAHPMGTDDLGRDVFTRVAFGAQVSLRVGVVAVALATVLGSLIGFTAGYFGRWWDQLAMRVMDIMLAFPTLLLAIAIVAMRGPGIFNAMLAIGVVRVPSYARISRATTISLREQDFVTAARSVGVPESRILFRHIVPNSLSPLIVQATLGIATAILDAAALGFLGLGAVPPDVEWGAMLIDSLRYLFQGLWWALLFPGFAIMLTVIGFNLIGDGLRDSLDPRLRT
jgi:peptide/nickel transport system permease protein